MSLKAFIKKMEAFLVKTNNEAKSEAHVLAEHIDDEFQGMISQVKLEIDILHQFIANLGERLKALERHTHEVHESPVAGGLPSTGLPNPVIDTIANPSEIPNSSTQSISIPQMIFLRRKSLEILLIRGMPFPATPATSAMIGSINAGLTIESIQTDPPTNSTDSSVTGGIA